MSEKFVQMTDELQNYVAAQCSGGQDPVLLELQEETRGMGGISEMMISLEQASLVGMLVALIGAKHALEIGTFTGTSSIAIARQLQPGGKLTCFDESLAYTAIARRYWKKAGVQERIDLRVGDARRMLPHYRPPFPLDFVFIDANKESYEFYFELLLPYVRNGGLILFDNTLRRGAVLNVGRETDPGTRAIAELNQKLVHDPRLQVVLVPIADGMTVCRRLHLLGNEAHKLTATRRLQEGRMREV